MKIKEIAVIFLLALFALNCGDEIGDGRPENTASTDKAVRRYNLDVQEEHEINRTPCDTASLQEHILEAYPAGEYLASFDKTYTYNLPGKAVVYHKRGKETLIFAAIAKSKPGERLIEVDNITGYESSFINLDSTKLGTAFFFLTLFKCDENSVFEKIWESEVPIHGGFNSMKLKSWNKIPYIELNFEAGIISGHRNYNFFMIDGFMNPPHLMETYVGIVHKRKMHKVNNDKYPDYLEYVFNESKTQITVVDSIPFYWDANRKLYITKRNSKWFRYY